MSTDVNDLFIGEQAIEAGLIDGIAGFEACIEKAMMLAAPGRLTQGISLSQTKEAVMDKFQTLAELKAAYPDFAAQLVAEGKAQAEAESSAKTARILAVIGAAFGEETRANVETAALGADATQQFNAMKALMPKAPAAAEPSAEDRKKAELLAGLKSTGAQAVGQDTNVTTDKDYLALVDEYELTHNVSRLVAMQKIVAMFPEKHEEYLQKVNSPEYKKQHGKGGR
jgi:hypothetical protein